jgi:hypothetical protein
VHTTKKNKSQTKSKSINTVSIDKTSNLKLTTLISPARIRYFFFLSLSLSLSLSSNMPRKRRRDEVENFQMMDVDFNPPVPIVASTSTLINISQWDIDGDRIHGTSIQSSMEDPTIVTTPYPTTQATTTPSATDPTFESATLDYNEADSTFHDADEDRDISPEDDPSAKRWFLSVSHFILTTIT